MGVVSRLVVFLWLWLWSWWWRARQALPIWGGDKNVPKRWGITPDSGSVSPSWWLTATFLTGAPLKGGCRCLQLTYCRPLSNNRCWRMSTNCQAAVGSSTLGHQQHLSTEGRKGPATLKPREAKVVQTRGIDSRVSDAVMVRHWACKLSCCYLLSGSECGHVVHIHVPQSRSRIIW